MMSTTGTRAAVYLRISQDRTGDAAGVARQREDCEALCKERGWTIVETYTDNDVSAYSGKARPGFRAMLEAAESGRVDVIVAYHVDRLYRRLRDLVPVLEVCERKGVHVATTKAGDLDLSTAAGRMMAGILGSVAEGESARQAERIRREKESRALQGKANGSMRSFGYDADGSVNAAEAEVVRNLVARFLAGESLRSLVNWLIESEVPTVKGGEWRHVTVTTILRSPKIAGLRSHRPRSQGRSHLPGKVVASGTWEAIITADEHAAVTALLSDPKRLTSKPGKQLLTGVLLCGRCSKPLNSHNDRKGRRYQCIAIPGSGKCGRLSIAAPALEEFVVEAVVSALYRADGKRRAVKRRAPVSGDAVAEAERLRAKLAELAGQYASDVLTVDEWKTAKGVLDERLAKLPVTESAQPVPNLPATASGFREWIATASVDVARAALRSVVRSITVRPSEPGASRDPKDRVDFDWID